MRRFFSHFLKAKVTASLRNSLVAQFAFTIASITFRAICLLRRIVSAGKRARPAFSPFSLVRDLQTFFAAVGHPPVTLPTCQQLPGPPAFHTPLRLGAGLLARSRRCCSARQRLRTQLGESAWPVVRARHTRLAFAL